MSNAFKVIHISYYSEFIRDIQLLHGFLISCLVLEIFKKKTRTRTNPSLKIEPKHVFFEFCEQTTVPFSFKFDRISLDDRMNRISPRSDLISLKARKLGYKRLKFHIFQMLHKLTNRLRSGSNAVTKILTRLTWEFIGDAQRSLNF